MRVPLDSVASETGGYRESDYGCGASLSLSGTQDFLN
jgi:hypothetical protein